MLLQGLGGATRVSTWVTGLGLPYPEANGYAYTVASGVARTSFDAARPRQKPLNSLNLRTFTLSVLLRQSQLGVAERFLGSYGGTWFTIPVLGGAESLPIIDMRVRLTGSFSVSAVGYDLYRMELPLESRKIPYSWVLSEYESGWVDSTAMRVVGNEFTVPNSDGFINGARFSCVGPSTLVQVLQLDVDDVVVHRLDNILIDEPRKEFSFDSVHIKEGSVVRVAMYGPSSLQNVNYFSLHGLGRGFTATAPGETLVYSNTAYSCDVRFRLIDG